MFLPAVPADGGACALRIALFTPFSPEIGGGSAQLRSHLRDLADLDVRWYYLAAKPTAAANEKWQWMGKPLSMGELIGDLGARSTLLPGSRSRVREIVRRLEADLFWVVGHYEGISVAAELCEQGKPVHLTVHDDPLATWKRSGRYRWFLPLLRRTFPRVLRGARSVDVTSWGMRNLYREKYGVRCFAVYLHVPGLPEPAVSPETGKLTVGHIGTLYAVEPFRNFVAACKAVAAEQGLELKILRVGSSAQIDAVAAEDPRNFVSLGELAEQDAVRALAACDLCYAMYPQGETFALFRRTSLPIKLSTYVQAQRPVFAHTPRDSTLARAVGGYAIGAVCESNDIAALAKALSRIRSQSVSREAFELIRKELMGAGQVEQLGAALRGRDWQNFPEYDFPPTGA
jgi:hypothetical protein